VIYTADKRDAAAADEDGFASAFRDYDQHLSFRSCRKSLRRRCGLHTLSEGS